MNPRSLDPFAGEVREEADRICSLIVASDYQEVDILIARSELRWRIKETMPNRLPFFEMIYESRFERLWKQFRGEEAGDYQAKNR